MQFDGQILFQNAVVASLASFQHIDFTQIADFTGTDFGKIPDFRNCDFKSPPELAGMTIPDRPNTHMKRGINSMLGYAADNEDVHRARKLKSMAMDSKDHEQELKFFAFEMRAKRGIEAQGGRLLANILYGAISEYGTSIAQPFRCLILSWFLFTWPYAFSGVFKTSVLGAKVANGMIASLHQTLPFLFPFERALGANARYPEWLADQLHSPPPFLFEVIALGQVFVSVVLIFFLLLGLRNRFKLK